MSSRRHRNTQSRQGRPGRQKRRGPGFQKQRLILGILCIAAAFVLVYRSCLAGVIKEGTGLGLLGLIPAVFFLLAGISAVEMKHRSAPMAYLIPAVLCMAADIASLVHGAKQIEWKLWGVAAAIFCVLFLVLFCFHRRRNLAFPAVLLALVIVVTAAVCLLAGKGKKDDGGQAGTPGTEEDGNEENRNEEGGTDGTAGGSGTGGSGASGTGTEDGTTGTASQDPQDGTLYLAADKFTLKYARHEVGTDVNGNPCLYVYYDFTNSSSEAETIPSVSYTKLIQNGTECGKASVPELNDEMNNYKSEVEPGTTVTACEVYALTDTSDVELQAVEFVPTNAKTASQTLTLSE